MCEIGYNPWNPGQPSHPLPTYLVAGLRLVLDTEVLVDNEGNSSPYAAGLENLDVLGNVNNLSLLARGVVLVVSVLSLAFPIV